jgi:hypothetical protein
MAAFSEILPLFGVDAAKGFMMVPVDGFNLIYHFLGKDATFAANNGRGLSIRDVTEEIRKAPDVSKISRNPKQPLFVDKDDMTAFLNAAFHALSTDPSQRLLAVTAKTVGIHTVTLKASRRSESLTVWALNERPTTTISFRYVKYVGQWPPAGATEKDVDRYSKGVTRTKAEGEKYAKLVSRLFRHQANISVMFKSSDDVGLDTPFGKAASNTWFKERLLPNRDKSADTTIFVVPFIDGAEGRSMIDNDPTALMVAENPTVVWAGVAGDPFQLVSAHELAHTLGSHHRKEGGLLMSNYSSKQSLLIDKDTLVEINPPFKR